MRGSASPWCPRARPGPPRRACAGFGDTHREGSDERTQDDPARGVYSMDAKKNSAFGPLQKVTLALTRAHQRLVYYNYPGDQQFEFYDLQQDPEELNDLFPSQPSAALQMKDELLQKLAEVNAPFEIT